MAKRGLFVAPLFGLRNMYTFAPVPKSKIRCQVLPVPANSTRVEIVRLCAEAITEPIGSST